MWIAEADGEIVGTAFSWVCGDLWFLAELFIAPRLQGSGIGSELLRRTLQHADQAAAKVGALITFPFNTVSQGLYIRHGMFPRLPLYMFSVDRDGVANRRRPALLKYRRAEASPPDLGTLAAIDLSALGVSREKHHKFLLDDAAMQGFLLYADDDCIGYAYVASTGHVGPLALTRGDAMAEALGTAFAIAAEAPSDQIRRSFPAAAKRRSALPPNIACASAFRWCWSPTARSATGSGTCREIPVLCEGRASLVLVGMSTLVDLRRLA